MSVAANQMPRDIAQSVAVREASVYFSIIAYDEVRVPFLEIRDRQNRSVITVVDLLSPTNKYSGPDRLAYLIKRQPMFLHGTNFVEIDLLRGGPSMPDPGVPPSDYSVVVRRAADWTRIGYWPIHPRDRLPSIPIPLKAPSLMSS